MSDRFAIGGEFAFFVHAYTRQFLQQVFKHRFRQGFESVCIEFHGIVAHHYRRHFGADEDVHAAHHALRMMFAQPIENAQHVRGPADIGIAINQRTNVFGVGQLRKLKVDPAQWTACRHRLLQLINPETDSLRFYFLGAKTEVVAAPQKDGARAAIVVTF